MDSLEGVFGEENAKKIQFSPVPEGRTGDIALKFFSLSKETSTPPIELAKKAEKALSENKNVIKTEIEGLYVNVFFENEALFYQAMTLKPQNEQLKGRKIVLEFSGPNTNKPLHLGHMRNHAIGLSMAHIYRANGATVIPVNIINDRGVHICKSMWAYQQFGKGKTPESENIKGDLFVGQFYVLASQKEKENPEIKKEIQAMLQQWEAGNPEIVALWKTMNSWTLKGHAQTYERQNIRFDKAYKESEYYQNGKELAQKGREENIVYTDESGAIMIDLEAENLDKKVVLRSDGTSIYLTQDLAVAKARKIDFDPTDLVYVVADEQNYHFKVLFSCLEKLKILPKSHLKHLGYGLVNLPDGRMKSRDELMNELEDLAYQKSEERNNALPEKEKKAMAAEIMNAAWKFTLLKTSTKKSITFDKEESMRFDGASGPYIQYSAVRILSLQNKEEVTTNNDDWKNLGAEERKIAIKLLAYPKAVQLAAEKDNPTVIVTYLLDLAQMWNGYYAQVPILNAETSKKRARMEFIAQIYAVLEHGLGLLDISIPKKM